MGREFRAKPVNFMKISVFQWILDIFIKTPYQGPWEMPVLTVLTSPDPYWHHRQDGPTGVSKSPIQSPWKSRKFTKIHEKCVENVTFSGIRFLGDIFDKNGHFRVFLRNSLKFRILTKVLGKTWHLWNGKNPYKPEVSRKSLKMALFHQKRQKMAILHFYMAFR